MKSMLCALGFFIVLSNSLSAGNEPCPEGFRDTGSHCLKPPGYGRGFGNRTLAHCEVDNGVGRCEKCLSLYYPRCHDSYETRGCNVCEPICPPNMTDIGVSCQK